MPKLEGIDKVLVIGSGPVVIGQAAEFDYSGTQACLALKEEGVEVVLVNNNPATIMTDESTADHVYLEPLTEDSLTAIIKKEKPDGLLPSVAGQTGLNLALALSEAGVLNQYNVSLLGTSLETIQKGEDREIFKSLMTSIGEPVPESMSVESADDAVRFSKNAGFPIIVRPAYTLGGAGGGVAENEQELYTIVRRGLDRSPISQVLVEQSVKGWKEIEFEVIRDAAGTCMIVCDMENVDPAGIHTGDSIVTAPAQTLDADDCQMLRKASFHVIEELGIVGACNIQFAVQPSGGEYVIIEVNPRVSRSSALASKATGCPIATIATKLALGYRLGERMNSGDPASVLNLDPAIDYTAVKLPRWPFDKFTKADRTLGTQMKATGEVLALANSFPAALTKAVLSLDIASSHFPFLTDWTDDAIEESITNATDERLFAVIEAFRRDFTIQYVNELSGINEYFLHEMAYLVSVEKKLAAANWHSVAKHEWQEAKTLGFSDAFLASLFGKKASDVRNYLAEWGIRPVYKMAGANQAGKPFFYSSWNEADEVIPLKGKTIVVLGSGPIRIGQGIEFDYCSVHAVQSLQKQGTRAVVVNNNPETVSTDWNIADHLYMEPLTTEAVLNVVKKEKADGVMVQFGGQTAINLAEELCSEGVHVCGTSLTSIAACEDREQFYQLLRKLKIPHIPGETVTNASDAAAAAHDIGYPVLVRPSYVIGGKGMAVLQNESELHTYLNDMEKDGANSSGFPLLIDQFIPGREFEIDAVCDGADVLIPGIFQHEERAGVHSGDSIAIFPAPDLTKQQMRQVEAHTKSISEELNLKGMVNIQFVLSEDEQEMYVLEVNPRASRTVPIASKVTGVPLIDLATNIQMGKPLSEAPWELGLHKEIPYQAVKMPVFSSSKLPGVDPYLGPEMQSTGEAIGIGTTTDQAIRKACGWSEGSLLDCEAGGSIYLSLDPAKAELPMKLVERLSEFNAGVIVDQPTAKMISKQGLHAKEMISAEEAKSRFADEEFAFVCDTNRRLIPDEHTKLRSTALACGIPCFTSLETLQEHLLSLTQMAEVPQSIDSYRGAVQHLNKKKGQVV
ncbi:carbamoyl-phosphate synthase (glutamine-hydrolyzing) large subunit [Lentibacillus lipolyticus]|nr:carbamoyl-phosphate synthase (glutamine-hydrolyzing) large subunit [Lentibacillus lipolyticus]